jgi:hypothetical protein
MELIYSTQSSGFEPDKRYRNPEHFDRPETGVTSVLVVGEWPKVVDAYKNAGVDVAVKDVARVLIVGAGVESELKDLIDRLNIERDLIVTLIESAEGLAPLTHPEAGELPIRLFDALSGIHQGITVLKTERDGLATENEALRGEVASLKALANKPADDGAEIEALKAALDAAKVTYRANASKESLQKQVDELPKS